MLGSLAKGLQNLSKGEKRLISLKAEEAYGLYFPQKVIFFPKRKLPTTVRVGENIAITGNDGLIRTYKVLEVYKNMVSLDGNHPLAGQDLVFEIEALEVRDATLEEIGESTNSISSQIWH
jgi:FKBP-type peptidyl-prolyl cis-trans isomerase SlyD